LASILMIAFQGRRAEQAANCVQSERGPERDEDRTVSVGFFSIPGVETGDNEIGRPESVQRAKDGLRGDVEIYR